MITRKPVRLKNYDYNQAGCYFVTVCTKEKKCILCRITENAQTHSPNVQFTDYGRLVDDQLRQMANFYTDISLEQYVIMPNHIHLMICSDGREQKNPLSCVNSKQNNQIGSFVGTLKRLTNKTAGEELWQDRSYDHIVRNEKDYLTIMQYMENNPAKWAEDGFFTAD